MFNLMRKPLAIPSPEEALPGRSEPICGPMRHFVNDRPLQPPFPDGVETVLFGMGCFWGAERLFWELGGGVWVTASGYAGGHTPNPTYEEVCSGRTGHTEVVLVAYDPAKLSFGALLKVFWEQHDPTQGMRQGADIGTQYRSAIYVADPARRAQAEESRKLYEQALAGKGLGGVTTEIGGKTPFYYAEEYHQQYLAKNPDGYCGIGGTGVACPVGVNV